MTRKPAELGFVVGLALATLIAGAVAVFALLNPSAAGPPALVEVPHLMNDGRTVLCIVNTDAGGLDCDWDQAA